MECRRTGAVNGGMKFMKWSDNGECSGGKQMDMERRMTVYGSEGDEGKGVVMRVLVVREWRMNVSGCVVMVVVVIMVMMNLGKC